MYVDLKRRQLKAYIDASARMRPPALPKKGWINALREYYGMSLSALARRIGLARSRVCVVEDAELTSSTTLETMKRFAEVLNCEFVYAFVPKEDPDQFLKRLAEQKADDLVQKLNATMLLEDQGVSPKELKLHRDAIVKELLDNPKKLWRSA